MCGLADGVLCLSAQKKTAEVTRRKERGAWGAKQKKEYILDKDGNKIYDPKKRQYKCKSVPATDWNEQTKAEEWRAAWARLCNRRWSRTDTPSA